MTLTDSTEQNGETLYTFKGLYYQNGYRDKPLPTNISMQYYDRMQTVFIADTENRLDYAAYRGNSEFYDALDELDAQTEEQLSAITNQGKADELIEGFRQSSAYKSLSADQKAAYDAAADSYKAPDDESLPDYPLMSDSFKISGTENFESFSAEDQALILEIEQSTQDYIDTLSAVFQLKKPLNAYTDVSEIYSELGYTITENYTAAPDKDFEQLDRYVWHRFDSEKKITSVIDTEKHVRVDVDYDKTERRRAEIESKLREAFGLNDSGKTPAPVGAGEGDGGSGDITLDQAYEYIKDRVDNQEESELEDIIADYSNSAYEYFAGDMLENVQKLGDSKLDEFIKSQALNYEKMLEAELAAGGDGTKALKQSERGVQFIANQEKWSKYLDKTGKGIDFLGDALVAWEVYKSIADINDYDEMVETYMKVQDALWDSKLPYEDKLKLMRDGEEYINAVMELRGVCSLDGTVNGVQLGFSLVGKFTDSPEYDIGSNVAGFIVPFAENYKNSTMKPALEETIRLKERRFLQLLEKAKRLENEDKKKRLQDLNIPYDDSTDLDFGVDIAPEVAEWYYQARLEEAQKHGVYIEPIMDPSGIVFEAVESNLLEGVTATVRYSPNADGSKAEIWNAEDYDQENPLTTGIGGSYAWDVPQGYWQVRFEKAGYLSAQTDWLPVPPPQLNIKTPMISNERPQVVAATAYPDYIELAFSQYMATSTALDIGDYNAEWTDKQLSPDNKELSKTLRLVPKNGKLPVGEEVSVTLSGAVNYAGSALDRYEQQLMVVDRPASVEITPDEVQIIYGGKTDITVTVLGADGKPMEHVAILAEAENTAIVGIESAEAATDDNGQAVFTVSGTDIGFTDLRFTVSGTTVSASVGSVVTADASALLGDADGDGEVTVMDASLIQRSLAQLKIEGHFDEKAADVDADGKIEVTDVTLIQRYAAKIDTPYRIGDPIA